MEVVKTIDRTDEHNSDKTKKNFTGSYTEVNPPAEVKDGNLINLPHKIEGLVNYRRAKITLKYTVFTFWRRYNIHTVGL